MSNDKSSTAIDDEKKKATNLYNALVNDSKSVFYATDKIEKTFVRKARNSLYKKAIFCKYLQWIINLKNSTGKSTCQSSIC